MIDQMETIGIRLSKQELSKLNRAWKQTDDCINRSQYIRQAINAYAGEVIFEEWTPGWTN